MQYLNKQIEAMVKRKKSRSLVRKQVSCGIFQDLGAVEKDSTEAKLEQQ